MFTYKTEKDLEKELMVMGAGGNEGKGQLGSLAWTCTHCYT